MAAPKSKAASRSRSSNGGSRRASGGTSKNAQHSSKARSARTAASKGSRNGATHRFELDHAKLVEFLSQMLAVERGGVMLYEKALNELMDEDLRDDLEEFLEQTHRHVELCEELLEQAGGSEDEGSAAAQAAQEKANGLMSVEVPEEMTDLNNIENLVLAETKDHWNWEMLGEISSSVKDRELRSTISRAVKEVSKQERRHLDWNTQTLSEIGREMMQRHQTDEERNEEDQEMEESV